MMYNNNPSSSTASSSEHMDNCPPLMSPRISFSNDFAESQYAHNQVMVMKSQNQKQSAAPTPTTSDFEFSVLSAGNSNNNNLSNMTTADELFHKGHLLPFKPPCNSKTTTTLTTLRDELLLEEEEEDEDQVSFSCKPPKTSTKWKGFLGIKTKKSSAHHKPTITSQQEMLSDGGSSCRDVEIGR